MNLNMNLSSVVCQGFCTRTVIERKTTTVQKQSKSSQFEGAEMVRRGMCTYLYEPHLS
jgi:hypothetical protein